MICRGQSPAVLDSIECYRKQVEDAFGRMTDDAGKRAPPTPPNAVTVKKIEAQKALFKALLDKIEDAGLKAALKAALDPPPPPPGRKVGPPKIHVLAAYFGHLDDIVYALNHRKTFPEVDRLGTISPRFCSATRVVRTICQGQGSCFNGGLGAGATTVTFTGLAVCGYEPAQYAEPRMKALVVSYLCTTDADWKPESNVSDKDEFRAIPNPVDFTKDTAKEFDAEGHRLSEAPQWALIRSGEATRITCVIPKPVEKKDG